MPPTESSGVKPRRQAGSKGHRDGTAGTAGVMEGGQEAQARHLLRHWVQRFDGLSSSAVSIHERERAAADLAVELMMILNFEDEGSVGNRAAEGPAGDGLEDPEEVMQLRARCGAGMKELIIAVLDMLETDTRTSDAARMRRWGSFCLLCLVDNDACADSILRLLVDDLRHDEGGGRTKKQQRTNGGPTPLTILELLQKLFRRLAHEGSYPVQEMLAEVCVRILHRCTCLGQPQQTTALPDTTGESHLFRRLARKLEQPLPARFVRWQATVQAEDQFEFRQVLKEVNKRNSHLRSFPLCALLLCNSSDAEDRPFGKCDFVDVGDELLSLFVTTASALAVPSVLVPTDSSLEEHTQDKTLVIYYRDMVDFSCEDSSVTLRAVVGAGEDRVETIGLSATEPVTLRFVLKRKVDATALLNKLQKNFHLVNQFAPAEAVGETKASEPENAPRSAHDTSPSHASPPLPLQRASSADPERKDHTDDERMHGKCSARTTAMNASTQQAMVEGIMSSLRSGAGDGDEARSQDPVDTPNKPTAVEQSAPSLPSPSPSPTSSSPPPPPRARSSRAAAARGRSKVRAMLLQSERDDDDSPEIAPRSKRSAQEQEDNGAEPTAAASKPTTKEQKTKRAAKGSRTESKQQRRNHPAPGPGSLCHLRKQTHLLPKANVGVKAKRESGTASATASAAAAAASAAATAVANVVPLPDLSDREEASRSTHQAARRPRRNPATRSATGERQQQKKKRNRPNTVVQNEQTSLVGDLSITMESSGGERPGKAAKLGRGTAKRPKQMLRTASKPPPLTASSIESPQQIASAAASGKEDKPTVPQGRRTESSVRSTLAERKLVATQTFTLRSTWQQRRGRRQQSDRDGRGKAVELLESVEEEEEEEDEDEEDYIDTKQHGHRHNQGRSTSSPHKFASSWTQASEFNALPQAQLTASQASLSQERGESESESDNGADVACVFEDTTTTTARDNDHPALGDDGEDQDEGAGNTENDDLEADEEEMVLQKRKNVDHDEMEFSNSDLGSDYHFGEQRRGRSRSRTRVLPPDTRYIVEDDDEGQDEESESSESFRLSTLIKQMLDIEAEQTHTKKARKLKNASSHALEQVESFLACWQKDVSSAAASVYSQPNQQLEELRAEAAAVVEGLVDVCDRLKATQRDHDAALNSADARLRRVQAQQVQLDRQIASSGKAFQSSLRKMREKCEARAREEIALVQRRQGGSSKARRALALQDPNTLQRFL